MKKAIALSLFILSACNTGNVQVGDGTQATPQPGTSGTTQNSSQQQNGQQPGSTKTEDSEKIFFERVTVRNALPQLLIAISFSSVNATGATPFGISLLGNQVFSANAPFVTGKNDLVYMRNVDVGTDALLSTSMDSLESTQIYGFPREVVDFSLSGDNSFVAWLDQAGVVTISKIEDGSTEVLDTTSAGSNTVFTHVQWSNDGSHLLVRAENGTALLFKSQSTDKPTLLSGVSASSFSNDGTQLAYFSSSAKALHIISLPTGADKVAGTFESSDIHDLSWNSPTSVSYWTTLATQAKELRVFSAGSNETTVAVLTLPASIQDGVVCPAWIGNKVYFGNYDSGKYVIEQIGLAKDAKKSIGMQIYAETPDADLSEGFVCPKVVK